MPRTAHNPPLLDEWLSHTDRRSAEQYAGVLRRLHREVNAANATSEALVAFVLGLGATGSRRKAVSAIVAFFGDLAERGVIPRDPSHRLAERVRDAAERQHRAAALATLGISPSPIGVTWRSVAARLVRGGTAVADVMELPDAPVVAQLESDLLKRLGGITRERFEALMGASVT